MIATIRSAGDLADAYDLVIVGAGAAGLSAAAQASALGLSVLLADENDAPGGQIYRGITRAGAGDRVRLGPDYVAGAILVADVERSSATYAPRATIWSLGRNIDEGNDEGAPGDLAVGISLGGAARVVQARRAILATGALERPFPIPGWTLPGVMTAGAAQILLKTSGLVPGGRVVVAGSGPLLYLLASQLIAAGVDIEAVLDTTPATNRRAAWRHAFGFATSAYGRKGAKLLLTVTRHAPVIRDVTALEIIGSGRAEAVSATCGDGTVMRIAADLVLLHQGVVPNLNLSLAAGCAYEWDELQAAFRPSVDPLLDSSVPGIAIAGDAAGIVGAVPSALQGEIAGLNAAWHLGRLDLRDRDLMVSRLSARLARALKGRAFIDHWFRPAESFRIPARDDVIVCRCEEVTAGRLRETMQAGVAGPNQLKAFLRCGMGPCQGRLCGLTVTEIMAEARGVPPSEIGYYRLRPPVKPVPLRELAALPQTDAAITAVAGFVEKPSASSGSQTPEVRPW